MRGTIAIRAGAASGVLLGILLAGCGGPEAMIISSVVQAAVKTAVAQAEKNRPTPEQLWHEAQVANLERRAIGGDVEAQFQIGTYYLLLQEPVAQRWICEAASRGHAKAQLQYGHWFNEDRTREDLFPFIAITPDNTRAYVWYSLAADRGEPRAPHFRDSVLRAGMPSHAVQAGDTGIAGWTPGPCTDGAAITAAAAGPQLTR
jgi:TPR repeat protein